MNFKNFILVLIVCCSSFMSVNAQRRKIDSLRALLKTAKEDTNKVNMLNMLSDNLETMNRYDSSLLCAGNAKNLAEELNYKKGIATALENIGIVYDDQGSYSKALDCYMKSLDLYKEIGYEHGITAMIGDIGVVYNEQGNYTKALEYYQKALDIGEQLGNKNYITVNLGNIGLIYRAQGNLPKALEYHYKALKLAEETGDKRNIAVNLSNIGTVYEEQGDNLKALNARSKALVIDQQLGNKYYIAISLSEVGTTYKALGKYPEALVKCFEALAMDSAIGNKDGIANLLSDISEIYNGQGNLSKALEYNLRSLDLYKEIGVNKDVAFVLASTGKIYIQQKNYRQAKLYLDSALTVAKRTRESDYIKTAYEGLAELDKATGNYKQALEDYTMYITYRDSIYNAANTKKSVQAEMNYQFARQQAAEKAAQDKKDAVVAEEKKKQQIGIYAVSTVLLLVSLLAGFILKGYKQKQKANLLLEEQKQKVDNAYNELREKHKEITDSISYAKRIQSALFKEEEYITKHLPEHFIYFKPKDVVSGDFYWGYEREGYWYVAAVDCTGHGVPGAFLTMLGSAFLNEICSTGKLLNPAEVLNILRDKVVKDLSAHGEVKDGMDISLCRIHMQTKTVDWAGAYNSLWYVENGVVKEINGDKQPIGISDNPKPFTNHALSLSGSTLYLFTDGYADQFGGPKGKKFKYKQLQEKLVEIHNKPMIEQRRILEQTFENWKGNLDQIDDILVMGIKV